MFAHRTDLSLKKDNHSRFLPWLIAFMVFLATLAIAGTYILNSLVSHWSNDLSGTITLQLPTAGNQEINNKNIEKALKILSASSKVIGARVVSKQEIVKLLKPWLGDTQTFSGIPLPQLIDIKVIPNSNLDFETTLKSLNIEIPGSSIDNHRVWLDHFLSLIRSIQTVAISVLTLIGFATIGMVIFTMRNGLAVHQEAIEVLHLIGAQDSYIASQFATRVVILTLRGGFIGLALAVPTLIFIGLISADINSLAMPKLQLGLDGWLTILAVPFFTAALAMVTARFTVLKSLSKML